MICIRKTNCAPPAIIDYDGEIWQGFFFPVSQIDFIFLYNFSKPLHNFHCDLCDAGYIGIEMQTFA